MNGRKKQNKAKQNKKQNKTKQQQQIKKKMAKTNSPPPNDAFENQGEKPLDV